jgi:hypothetical protein
MRLRRVAPYGQHVLRSTATAIATGLALTATACGTTTPKSAPRVTGEPLNVAEDRLDGLGLRYRTVGGGTFGILVRSHWFVCSQAPEPPRVAREVVLTVAKSCTVPDTVGESLDDAEDELEDIGIDARVHSLDGGPVVMQGLWTVCRQTPEPGAAVQPVDLYVSHDCSSEGG